MVCIECLYIFTIIRKNIGQTYSSCAVKAHIIRTISQNICTDTFPDNNYSGLLFLANVSKTPFSLYSLVRICQYQIFVEILNKNNKYLSYCLFLIHLLFKFHENLKLRHSLKPFHTRYSASVRLKK